MTDFSEVKQQYEEFWKQGISCWNPYISRANISMRAYAGDTWTQREKEILRQEGREPVELDLIRPYINLFSGYMRDNMKSTVAGAREGSDQETADQISNVMEYVYDYGDALYCLNNSFQHTLITGISLVGIYMDYSEDFINGDIKFYKRSYNSFLLDPNMERMDLKDCSEALLRDFVTREEAKSLLPFVDPKIIDELPAFQPDDKFRLMSSARKFRMRTDLLSYDSYYRKVTKRKRFLVDLQTGEKRELNLNRDQMRNLRDIIAEQQVMGNSFDIISRNVLEVELNILLSGEVVYVGPDPTGIKDRFPFVPIFGYWEPNLDDFSLKLQGLASGLVDAQRIYNKQTVKVLDIFHSGINQGYWYKPGKLLDVNSITQSGSYRNIPMSNDAEIGRDFAPIQQGNPPPGMIEYGNLFPELMQKIVGTNETLFGQDEGGNSQVSGRLAEVRAANGLRANRSIFDNFEQAMKRLGSLVIQCIQINFSPEKVRRIIQKDPTKEFYDSQFGKYDAVVKNAVLSQSQKDTFYFELLRAREILGDVIPADVIIEAMPMVGKSELLKVIKENAEMQKMQQQAATEQEMQDKARRDALIDSQTEQSIALASERRARVLSDLGLARERISQVQDNRASAALDRAKALSELQKMSDDRLMTVVNFLKTIEQDLDTQTEKILLSDMERERSFGKEIPSPGVESIQQRALETQQEQPNFEGGLNG